MSQTKYIAVIEIELPIECKENAELAAEVVLKQLSAHSPKLVEIYSENGQDRELLFNQ